MWNSYYFYQVICPLVKAQENCQSKERSLPGFYFRLAAAILQHVTLWLRVLCDIEGCGLCTPVWLSSFFLFPHCLHSIQHWLFDRTYHRMLESWQDAFKLLVGYHLSIWGISMETWEKKTQSEFNSQLGKNFPPPSNRKASCNRISARKIFSLKMKNFVSGILP